MSVETVDAERQLAATKKRARIGALLSLTLLALLALLWIVLAFSTPSFWTYNNITNLLHHGAITTILAIGDFFVIITGVFALSVEAILGFTSVIIVYSLPHTSPI